MMELTDVVEPNLGGIHRMLGQNSNSLTQAEWSDLFRRILVRISTRAEQQEGLADLGMCLIIGHFKTGWFADSKGKPLFWVFVVLTWAAAEDNVGLDGVTLDGWLKLALTSWGTGDLATKDPTWEANWGERWFVWTTAASRTWSMLVNSVAK